MHWPDSTTYHWVFERKSAYFNIWPGILVVTFSPTLILLSNEIITNFPGKFLTPENGYSDAKNSLLDSLLLLIKIFFRMVIIKHDVLVTDQ